MASSAYRPPVYIDNELNTLAEVLKRAIAENNERRLDIATGYFNPNVWHIIGEVFNSLTQFRLLLGTQTEADGAGTDFINLRSFFRAAIKGELDKLILDSDTLRIIDDLIAFLRRDTIAVRIFRGEFLHAKAYLFDNIGIVGSSNFTPAGLRRNSELDLVSTDWRDIGDLRNDWYERKWAEAEDYKPELIQLLDDSKFGGHPYTPHDVFIKALYEYFRDRLAVNDERQATVELAAFQEEGLKDALILLDRHDGVLIADAVGLGKTFIGLRLLEHYLIGRRRPNRIPKGLVICPAQLRELVWQPRLDDFQIKADIVSQEELGRDDFDWRRYRNYDFVLVDESHNFRNPNTNRYRNLMLLLSTGKRKKVALMTATPINNTIWDYYHQVMLLTRNREDYYRDFGVLNIRGFIGRVDKGAAELFDILEETTVRRSRHDIRRRQDEGQVILIGGEEVKFPFRKLQRIDYNLEGTYKGFYKELAHTIEHLNLASYNLEQFKRAKTEETLRDEQRSNALVGILKTVMLKRLESSMTALEISLKRQAAYQQRFADLLADGKVLTPRAYRKVVAIEDDEESVEAVERELSRLDEVNPLDYDLEAMKGQVAHDVRVLGEMVEWLGIIRGAASLDGQPFDAKLEAVKSQLAGEMRGQKVLIFTYFHDTALYVIDALKGDPAWYERAGNPTIEVIHGGLSARERQSRIERFAPLFNSPIVVGDEEGSQVVQPPHDPIDILITTDVLSEGQNLQEAGILINYDLHWNPVRMIQRAGRIDRLRSPFKEIVIANCFPEQGLDELLHLVTRLQVRIQMIDRTIGLDASVLGELVSPKSIEDLRRIRDGDAKVIEEYDLAADLMSADDMRRPLILYIQRLGEKAIQDIPMGIHSARKGMQPGTFFSFRARDRHLWRFYPEQGEAVITSPRQLFSMIQCSDSEPRQPIELSSVLPLLRHATTDILRELRRQETTSLVPSRLTGINARLHHNLSTPTFFDIVDEEVKQRVKRVLEEYPLRTFERTHALRALRKRYDESKDLGQLITDLDAFFVEHGLYEEISEPRILEYLKDEDLQLVCFEVFV